MFIIVQHDIYNVSYLYCGLVGCNTICKSQDHNKKASFHAILYSQRNCKSVI